MTMWDEAPDYDPDVEDRDYYRAVDEAGPPADLIYERDLPPLDHDPRESLDDPWPDDEGRRP